MADPFPIQGVNFNGPSLGMFAITPSDSVDLPSPIRAIVVGDAAGTIAAVGVDGVTRTSGTLPQGLYAVLIRRVLATGTTATGLTGMI